MVHGIDNGLPCGLGSVLVERLVQLGHSVQGHNTTTHEDGLHGHDGAGPQVACVGVEGIYYLLSLGVKLFAYCADVAVQHLLQASRVYT